MSPGERCDVTSNGSTTTKSYDELKSAKKSIAAPVIGIVLGGVVLALGGFVAWVSYRASRE
jgi:hypothetical protein